MIYLLCLHGVRTGGPEAIHQLSDALLTQGFEARMVYYTWAEIAKLEQAEPQDGYRFSPRSNGFEDYAHYQVKEAHEIPNAEDVVVVLPETLCHLAPKFNRCKVVVWWLSVDNGFGALSKVNLNYLRADEVYHATQSIYASRFVSALELPMAPGPFGRLQDYTIDLSVFAKPMPWAERPMLVAYNANHKVTANIAAIKEARPEISFVRVSGARAEVAALLSYARAYLDLGSFPGKDRLPREAILMGCVPIVASNGAGYTDFPNWCVLPHDDFAERSAAKLLASLEKWDFSSVMEVSAAQTRGERNDFMADVHDIFSRLLPPKRSIKP